MAFIGAGELFGEIGFFFDHYFRVRTLRATEHAVIRTWDQEVMSCRRDRDPVFYEAFVTLGWKIKWGK